MIAYIAAFIFYTLAMVGILLVGFVVYKKMQINQQNENKGTIKIIDSIMIAPKKTLLVVKVKNEKFLIASGAEHTTFLSKLEDGINKKMPQQTSDESPFSDISDTKIKRDSNYFDLSKNRNGAIQKQFMELMEEDDTPQIQRDNVNEPVRKEAINRLLAELGKTGYRTESRY